MQRLLRPATPVILAILGTLIAGSDPTLTPAPTATRTPMEATAPIKAPEELQSALSEGELACIGDVPETLDRVALA